MQALAEIVDFLQKNKLKLVTAESCTCGLMASLLGDIPGCGQVLDSGFVVYSPTAKNRLLGVQFKTIERFGLTSEEVAGEMARGALDASLANLAIANTGVADGAQEDESGTQCFAYALRQGARLTITSETLRFEGDRVDIRKQAAHYGLQQLPGQYQALLQKLR